MNLKLGIRYRKVNEVGSSRISIIVTTSSQTSQENRRPKLPTPEPKSHHCQSGAHWKDKNSAYNNSLPTNLISYKKRINFLKNKTHTKKDW